MWDASISNYEDVDKRKELYYEHRNSQTLTRFTIVDNKISLLCPRTALSELEKANASTTYDVDVHAVKLQQHTWS